jgi:hypothetical protein
MHHEGLPVWAVGASSTGARCENQCDIYWELHMSITVINRMGRGTTSALYSELGTREDMSAYITGPETTAPRVRFASTEPFSKSFTFPASAGSR